MKQSNEPLFLLAIDGFFADVLKIVGHSEKEIADTLPVFRQQFLTTLFFALSTFQKPEDVEAALDRLRQHDFTALEEFSKGVERDDWLGCYFYALQEVYGSYAVKVMSQLDAAQKKKLAELLGRFQTEVENNG